MKPRSYCQFLTWLISAAVAGLLWLALSSAQAAEGKVHKVVEIEIRELDPAAAAKVSYARQIKPILVDNCLECHSTEDHKGGLDATSVAKLIKGGKKASPAILPGKPDDSPFVQYLRGLREPQMPKGNPVLSEDELHLVRLWILAGANDDSEQVAAEQKASAKDLRLSDADPSTSTDPAIQKAQNILMFSSNNEEKLFAQRTLRLAMLPKPPQPPKVNGPTFNPIDQFIVAKWEQAELDDSPDSAARARHSVRAAGGSQTAPPATPTDPGDSLSLGERVKVRVNNAPPHEAPSPSLCSDAAFLRRVYLDIIGVIPTEAEAKSFLNDKSPDKRTRRVDDLLARNEDYAAHWTPFWEEAIGSANVDKVGGIASRGNHRDWLFKSFVENKPFDLMVAELIDPTLPGSRKPIVSEANGKRVVAAYIRNESHLDTIQSAAAVGQVFMGTGMKCASCHSHFLNKEWPQARFLAFAGLFASNNLELIRCEQKSGQFISAKFPFDLPGVPDAAPKQLNQRLHRAAQCLIDPLNPRFSRTIINRLWKRYLGLGLFEPQDDFRLDHAPSNPELLEWLAADFMLHGYDIKHTIRLILTSRTYQLRYNPELEDHFDVNKPEQVRFYRSPSLRRLTAEQLLDSISVAMGQKLDPQKRLYLDKASTALTRALGRPASRNEISTARPDDVAVVQALELLNGEEFYERVYSGKLTAQAAKQENEKDVARVIDRLYWATLSRPASPQEQALASNFLKNDQPEAARNATAASTEPVGDMLWALFACPEFQYIR